MPVFQFRSWTLFKARRRTDSARAHRHEEVMVGLLSTTKMKRHYEQGPYYDS